MQISAVSAFCLWLTIVCIGYIFVEILRWNKYFLRKSLTRNNNYRLDRLIHYILRWLILNWIIFYIIIYTWSLNELWNLFNISGSLAKVFNEIWPAFVTNLQMIIFSIYYFFFIILESIAIFFCIKIISWLLKFIWKKISKI